MDNYYTFPSHFCLNTCSSGDNYVHARTVDTRLFFSLPTNSLGTRLVWGLLGLAPMIRLWSKLTNYIHLTIMRVNQQCQSNMNMFDKCLTWLWYQPEASSYNTSVISNKLAARFSQLNRQVFILSVIVNVLCMMYI